MATKVSKPSYKPNAKQTELRDLIAGHRFILAYGSGRAGKTFETMRCIATRAIMAPGSRHALVRMRLSHVRTSLWPDWFKMMRICYPQVKMSTNKQDMVIEIQTQGGTSEIWFGGLDDPVRAEKILGMEFATIFCNESSQIPYQSFTMLLTRLAQRAEKLDGSGPLKLRAIVDLNPTGKEHWTYKRWFDGIDPQDHKPLDMSDHARIHMRIEDNLANISPEALEQYRLLPEAQRKRFYLGEYSDAVEGALWRTDRIERVYTIPDDLRRVIVAVDPAVSSLPGSDETGIIVAGLTSEGWVCILEDASGRLSVEEWTERVVGLYRAYQADAVVFEANQGGNMVRHAIETVSPNTNCLSVHATRGKWVRAEPVAGLYMQKKVKHLGVFDRLEGQMAAFTPDFDRKAAGYSPDRVDAMVWAVTELMPDALPVVKHGEMQYRPPQHKSQEWRPGGEVW